MKKPNRSGLFLDTSGFALSTSILSALLALSVALGGLYVFYALRQKKILKEKVAELSRSKDELAQAAQKMQKALSEKEEALELAQKQNFQQDLVVAQAALREINEKLSQIIREKASLQNSNLILDNRLKNTTNELTRTLDELKKARETLAGIDNQYKMKMGQLAENARLKDEQMQKYQSRITEKEGGAVDLQQREKESADSLRRYQSQMNQLEKDMASLRKSLADKEKMLSQKEEELARYKKGAQAPARTVAAVRPASDERMSRLEEERAALERQISESSARLLDQQERLKDMEKDVAELNNTLAERELVLKRREKELRGSTEEILAMKEEISKLRSAATYAARTEPLLSQTQKELERKVQQLEKEKRTLENRLQDAESARTSGVKAPDPFADRNFRIMTETLVKKEEEIRGMTKELESLRREKTSREGGAGLKEKRLAELEILVTTLTKQLGEYAGMIDRKETELKASNAKVAALAQEIEAQKIAAIALQRELADARLRQEKTFQSLTQVMSMNAETGPVSSDAPETGEEAEQNGPNVRKRAEDLRRRVEVLLEQKI